MKSNCKSKYKPAPKPSKAKRGGYPKLSPRRGNK